MYAFILMFRRLYDKVRITKLDSLYNVLDGDDYDKIIRNE